MPSLVGSSSRPAMLRRTGEPALSSARVAAARAPKRRVRTALLPSAARWLCSSPVSADEARAPSTTKWGPPPPGTKVFACMSGGVDSSVATRLLLEQGYDVSPVFMRNWDTLDEEKRGSGGCEWERDWEDVRRVCREHLGGVKPELVDLTREYWTTVFEPALEGWAAGVTPNPDVTCNQHIKFKVLPERLLARDASAWISTGHYAQLLPSPLNTAEPALHRAANLAKDQSHYLSTSPVSALRRTLFPLGGFASKDEVRDLARRWGMHTGDKKDSMGICFVGARKGFSGFLDSYLSPSPGKIETGDGRVVGEHSGLWRFTVGEGARLSGFPHKMFVGRKDTERNVVIVVPKSSPMLRCTAIETTDFRWTSPFHPPSEVDDPAGFSAEAQTRSLPAGALANCIVKRRPDGTLHLSLQAPLVGVSPGQTVALYRGSWCLGGGTIARTRTLADADIGAADDTGSAA
ncbi:tRNA methyl transferase-domain-containing protein [Rhodotorula diobovata]|uniref:tRNA-5-taurinomethyluridine 2-sulfurtransferase n=1 Tax=Rhodotorula diobovata TaxID=5288 RepID=A0A5C5FW31_9BASI|nr:tRNA methyl transferase-domain-containing protein [Rhodotorula diobovata]